MKILQVLPALELGGVERGTVDLAVALKRRGEGAVVVSSGGALVQELEREKIPHYPLPVHQKSIFILSLVSRLAEIIQRERVDVVHARSRVPAWVAWLACRRTGIPLVTTCHGYYSNHFLSRVMGWGRKVIVPSQVIARHMIEDFGVSPERIVLIPRGVDLTEFPFDPHKYEKPPSHPYRILNVGRLSPIKGQLEFIRAVHLLRQKGMAVEASLVGSEGGGKTKYTREIDATIARFGLEKQVLRLGTRRDIPELLKQADLLVLSSRVPESFGRVLIEAGAAGTACAATRLGGVLEIIEEGKEGLLFPPQDEVQMAEVMARLLQNRREAGDMAARLRQKVEKNFSLEQMTEKTLGLYRQVQGEKKILVIKIGALGDVILVGPSLRMLRKKFPQAKIDLLVDPRFAPVISRSPDLHEVILFDRRRARSWFWLARFAKRLRREGYDLSVDFQNNKRTHLLAFLAGVPARYGFRRGIFGRLLNHPDFTFQEADSPVRHQFRILSRLGINQFDERLELWPDPESDEKIDGWFEEKGFDPAVKKVGLVIGSSPRWLTKRWPVESFRALAGRLMQELGAQVVLIGSGEDRPLAGAFDSKSKLLLDLVGKTTLRDTVSLVNRLDFLVTGDTAPLHIGGALGKPMAALFGPTDPKRHLVPSPRTSVFVRRLPCQPCYSGTCTYSEPLACLVRIGVNEVFEAIKKQLFELPVRERA